MTFKFLPQRLKKQAKSIFNKNTRLATEIVDPKPVSRFDLSYRHMTSFDSGSLVPIFFQECLPGDIWDIDVNVLLRMGTPQAATMENPIFDISFFFVPNRTIWDGWVYFMGESKSAGYQENYDTVPVITFDAASFSYNESDLASYMGFPQNITLTNLDVPVSALPFKAYIKIWNDYYRDENLQSEIDNTNNNNPDGNVLTSSYASSTDYNVTLQIGKGLAPVSRLADYFSTCLPWPQKGDPVSIDNISLENLVVTGGVVSASDGSLSKIIAYDNDGNLIPASTFASDGSNAFRVLGITNSGNSDNNGYVDMYNFTGTNAGGSNPNSGLGSVNQKLKIDSNATIQSDPTRIPYNINDLRLAIAIQHLRELDARGGTRYVEILLNHFGVVSSDSRLQRAEYIGGWRDVVQIGNVVQSSAGNGSSPLGVLGGVSVTGSTSPSKISYACEEHGYIFGLITVRSNINYSQGLSKHWTKVEKYDFYDPLLANIGEQPVKKHELFLGRNNGDGTSTNNDIFGYNEPWAEYRYTKNILSGYVSANSSRSLMALYAYGEKYASAPTLSSAWMTYSKSIIGNTQLLNNNLSEYIHQFLGDFYFKAMVTRRMPVYGIPGLKRI